MKPLDRPFTILEFYFRDGKQFSTVPSAPVNTQELMKLLSAGQNFSIEDAQTRMNSFVRGSEVMMMREQLWTADGRLLQSGAFK